MKNSHWSDQSRYCALIGWAQDVADHNSVNAIKTQLKSLKALLGSLLTYHLREMLYHTLQVRRELFDCIAREVRDELNIPRENQQPPELLGTVINHERAGRLCKYL